MIHLSGLRLKPGPLSHISLKLDVRPAHEGSRMKSSTKSLWAIIENKKLDFSVGLFLVNLYYFTLAALPEIINPPRQYHTISRDTADSLDELVYLAGFTLCCISAMLILIDYADRNFLRKTDKDKEVSQCKSSILK